MDTITEPTDVEVIKYWYGFEPTIEPSRPFLVRTLQWPLAARIVASYFLAAGVLLLANEHWQQTSLEKPWFVQSFEEAMRNPDSWIPLLAGTAVITVLWSFMGRMTTR